MLVVPTGRTPFEVSLLGAAVAAGGTLTAAGTLPWPVSVAMPVAVQGVWQVALVVTGLVGLVGVYWRGELATGLAVELGALAGLGAVTCMYAIALIAVSGTAAVASAAFVAAVGVASWWRAAQIVRDLRRMARACSAGTTGGLGGG